MNKIIIASGPVIIENGKVLLNKHGDTAFWKFCGGRTENLDVDLIGVAKREVKEEMGIDIDIVDQTPFVMHTKKETEEGSVDVILVHYLSKRIGEVNPGDEIREWKFIDLNELEKEYLGPNILPALKHFKYIN